MSGNATGPNGSGRQENYRRAGGRNLNHSGGGHGFRLSPRRHNRDTIAPRCERIVFTNPAPGCNRAILSSSTPAAWTSPWTLAQQLGRCADAGLAHRRCVWSSCRRLGRPTFTHSSPTRQDLWTTPHAMGRVRVSPARRTRTTGRSVATIGIQGPSYRSPPPRCPGARRRRPLRGNA